MTTTLLSLSYSIKSEKKQQLSHSVTSSHLLTLHYVCLAIQVYMFDRAGAYDRLTRSQKALMDVLRTVGHPLRQNTEYAHSALFTVVKGDIRF